MQVERGSHQHKAGGVGNFHGKVGHTKGTTILGKPTGDLTHFVVQRNELDRERDLKKVKTLSHKELSDYMKNLK
jgi:hypothetical protein